MKDSSRAFFALIPLFAAVALTLLWPGDVPWQIDEPRLIANAWHANHDREMVPGGLWGNFGIRYGPLPTWTYQGLLLLTHDPVTLALLRALLCVGVTAASFYWLARELKLPIWFAAALIASPLVVEYHRILWDASFALPLSALTLAAFVAFLRTGGAAPLLTTLTGTFLVPTIHPQGLPLAVPVFGWIIWKQRPALLLHFKAVLVLVLVLGLSHLPWFFEAVWGVMHNVSGSLSKGYPNGASHWACALAPLLGGNLLGGQLAFGQVFVGDLPPAVRVAQQLLGLIYPLAWIGIAVSFWRVWKAREFSPRDALAATAVGGVILQAVLFGVLRIPPGPQYFFGTFALHAVLAWLAVDELRYQRAGKMIGAIFSVTAFSATIALATRVHVEGFNATLGWPTLRAQVAVVRALNQYDDVEAHTNVRLYLQGTQALRTLRLLMPPSEGTAQRHSGRLSIEERGKEIELVERDAPAGTVIDVTPLPKGWIPEKW